MNLVGKKPTFRQQRSHSNPYRVLALLFVLIIAIFLLRAVEQEQIEPLFNPTAIPTRTAESYALEGETRFVAGDLNGAIQAYQEAVELDPENATLWAELARIQVYSSALMTTDQQQEERLQKAIESIETAVELAPDNSMAHTIRAFALDWYADPAFVGDEWQNMLTDAEQTIVRALQLDNQNTLALAYYAEILIDQQRLLQAEQVITEALERDSGLMDVYRVSGYVRESLGYYGDAITEYQKAAEVTPNLTFLYIRIGVNYRQLQQYELALEYFDKAASINEQINVQDPIPYLAIGNTYSQMGEFFIAARNVQKVLEFNPTDPNIYGTLGIIYFKARNYESAIPALKCASYGCSKEESCYARYGQECESEDLGVEVSGMPLTENTVIYYYTYGSVLAGMHRPYNNYCEEALDVLKDVRDDFSNEPVIIQIIQTSEEICFSFGYSY